MGNGNGSNPGFLVHASGPVIVNPLHDYGDALPLLFPDHVQIFQGWPQFGLRIRRFV